MKKLSSIKCVGVALILMCCVILNSCKEAPKQTMAASEYKVLKVEPTNKLLSSSYSATFSGKQSVEIRPQVAGVITEVCIKEGAMVKKGQPLFIIDQVPYKAALQTAKANVASAKAGVATSQLTVDSKKALFAQNVVSSFDLQQAENDLLVRKAALAQADAQEVNAQNNLSYTVVKSPLDGVASMIPYRVGTLVSSTIATPLVTVCDDSEMYTYFSMTEEELRAITPVSGSTSDIIKSIPVVQLKLKDGSIYPENGVIDAISGIISQSTGSISLRASFPNKDRAIRSGGSGNVVVPYQKDNCIVIPQAATFEIQDKIYVYKVVNGKAEATRVVAFRINDGKEYIIESGVSAGDMIVAEGVGLVRDGASIKVGGEVAAAKKDTTQNK